ncbi:MULTISPECIES: hypothetical protein [unclassified Streptomyces]|uniref:hypothetical protein n=1 Tax=unclassified Streptomyces TaxID=2593676 RepID=UPI002E0EC673|nr:MULTISPECIES: hypothetical protein [unclassified Streptomyces]WSR26503.1 hypothetical protein OG573_10420 [Streptomyces sp. NBC_01205]
MNVMKRRLAALVLTSGAALALTPVAAHADGPTLEAAAPLARRVGDVVDHPAHAVQDTKTAVGVTASAARSATKATDSSLAGAGSALGGLPKPPAVR